MPVSKNILRNGEADEQSSEGQGWLHFWLRYHSASLLNAMGLHIRDHNCPPSARDPKKLAKAKFWWVVGLEQEQVRGCCPEPVFKGDRDFRLLIHSWQGGSIATTWLVSCEFCKIKYIKSICTGPLFSHLFLRKLDPQIYILICVQLSPPH